MKQLILCALLIASLSVHAQQVKEHTVASGETLQSIAAKYNVSESDLRNSNPGLDDYLFTGMVLKLPTTAKQGGTKNVTTQIIPVDDLKDVIYLKDGSELVAKILKIESDAVSFEQYDTDEPFTLDRDLIFSIKFENGTVTNFTKSKNNGSNKRKRRR